MAADNDGASRGQSQACLGYAEAQPILGEANDGANRGQSQACLGYAEAQPILGAAKRQDTT